MIDLSIGDLEFLQKTLYHEAGRRQRTLDKGRVPPDVYEANERRLARIKRIIARVEETLERVRPRS